jgi:hypothetical protein
VTGRGASSATGGNKRGKPRKAGKQGCAEGDARRFTLDGAAQDDTCRNFGKLGHWAKDCQQPRPDQAHVTQAEEEEPASLLAHASIKKWC